MPEIYRTILPTDSPRKDLQLILAPPSLSLEVFRSQDGVEAAAPVCRLTLPLTLWPRFYEAVCCLGAFMKPLPAPAYQTMSCCSYTCPATPETMVLGEAGQEQFHLSLQDRRGSTFLKIRALEASPAEISSAEARTLRIGPTLWSAFLAIVQILDRIIVDL
jgi:hypothetical protein